METLSAKKVKDDLSDFHHLYNVGEMDILFPFENRIKFAWDELFVTKLWTVISGPSNRFNRKSYECVHSTSNADEKPSEIESSLKMPPNVDMKKIVWTEDTVIDHTTPDGVAIRLNRTFQLVRSATIFLMCAEGSCSLSLWVATALQRLTAEIRNLVRVLINRQISKHLSSLIQSLKSKEGELKNQIIKKFTENTCDRMIYQDPLYQRFIIRAISIMQNIYYALYHYSILSPLNATRVKYKKSGSSGDKSTERIKLIKKRKFPIPPPADYLFSFMPIWKSRIDYIEDIFFDKHVDIKTAKKMKIIWGDFDTVMMQREENPLHAIWYLKWKETLAFVYHYFSNDSDVYSFMRSGTILRDEKSRHKVMNFEPLCIATLQEWRDASRDWPSLLYSYAVPTPLAMKELKKHSPIVEIGSGTGYWLKLMKQAGIECLGYDKVRPSENGEQNEFHANTAMHTNLVHNGDERELSKHREKSLFICFPPPQDPMAYLALKIHAGKTVIYVGEFQGFTADDKFEIELFTKYNLQKVVALPNWADTSYSMTVWKRKSIVKNSGLKRQIDNLSADIGERQIRMGYVLMLTCIVCGKGGDLRRCRITRMAAFCSEKCFKKFAVNLQSLHSLIMMFIKKKEDKESVMKFNHDRHFRDINITNGIF